MSKQDLEFKLWVICHYPLDMDGQETTARLFDINKSGFQKWFSAYERHGLDGLTRCSGSDTPEFKESVIQHRQQQHLSCLDHIQIADFSGALKREWVGLQVFCSAGYCRGLLVNGFVFMDAAGLRQD